MALSMPAPRTALCKVELRCGRLGDQGSDVADRLEGLEQLYLAIRFGYISAKTGGAEPLPIVMDDVLVNFDPTRAAAAAAGILHMAKSRQILFFTCHPTIVQIFTNPSPGVPVDRIGQADIVPGTAGAPIPLQEDLAGLVLAELGELAEEVVAGEELAERLEHRGRARPYPEDAKLGVPSPYERGITVLNCQLRYSPATPRAKAGPAGR